VICVVYERSASVCLSIGVRVGDVDGRQRASDFKVNLFQLCVCVYVCVCSPEEEIARHSSTRARITGIGAPDEEVNATTTIKTTMMRTRVDDAVQEYPFFVNEIWTHPMASRTRDDGVWEELAMRAVTRTTTKDESDNDDNAFGSRFKRYFIADYIFLEDFINLIANAIASAKSFLDKRAYASFLHALVEGEASLFRETLSSWGVDPDGAVRAPEGFDATGVARDMSTFLRRVSKEEAFLCKAAVIATAESLYLGWGDRVSDDTLRALAGSVLDDGRTDEQRLYEQWCHPLHSGSDFEQAVFSFVKAFERAWTSADDSERGRCRAVIDEMLVLEDRFTDVLRRTCTHR